MQPTRIEQDSWGEIEVDAERLWGAQTERSRRLSRISGERMPRELVQALVLVKKAAALVHIELGLLDDAKGRAIVSAADEVLAGRWDDEFPLVVWQTGSGTQTNMNVNEVLANRASEILGGERGARRLVHPNDDVNRGQSTNDAFPTAIPWPCRRLEAGGDPGGREPRGRCSRRPRHFAEVVKIGRTHLMDATPLTLGQEISGWAQQLEHGIRHLEQALPHLQELALGGTAVGTGLNAHPEYAERVAQKLAELTGHSFVRAPNKFEALGAHDALVYAHGALRTVAVSLFKIASDVRLLASGPRSGIGEIKIPENEPGSSIMPGKVNPTQAEALTMAAAQVMGNDVTVGSARDVGQLQLNVFMPVIAHDVLQSCRLIADGCRGFREHCALGIEPRSERIAQNLERSLMLVTALNPHIPSEAIISVVAIGEKVMVIPCGVGSDANSLHLLRQILDRLFHDSQEVVIGRNIAVPELRMRDKLCFRPVDVEWLIRFVTLIAEERVFLACLHESGVDSRVAVLEELNGGDEIAVDAGKSGESGGVRNGGASLYGRFFRMEARKPSEDRGRRRDGAGLLGTPARGRGLRLDTAKYTAEALIRLQNL